MENIRPANTEDNVEQKIQINIAQWQAIDNPLATLTEEQMDTIYQIKDLTQNVYFQDNSKVFIYNTVNNEKKRLNYIFLIT